ncbi:MAG: family N-acetyltransferase [Flavipsychrobacter sp.]|jgi:ribosomal-protein-serine acetyltransferase|nr:family N-acetyltransferase [Flavipsychrobacter sp.]
MVSIIVDENLLLRTYEVDDADALFNAINESRSHLHTWLPWVGATTKPEHSLQFIQLSHQQLNNQEGLALGIFYNGNIIGGVGMHDWDQVTKRAQIGYWISKGYEGRGIINKCLSKLIAYLFDKLTLNKVEIHFIPQNKRSAKVAARLGFKTEGIIRQSTMRNGMPEDMVVTGLLRSEFTP